MMPIRSTFIAALAALAVTPALAQDHDAIAVEDAYARVSPGKSGAIFLTLHNHGDQDDRLVGASVAGDIAERAELHTHVEDDDGVMRMIEVTEGFALPAGESLRLERGGAHVMLMGVKDLKDGDSFPVVLSFEHAPEAEADVTVDNARAPAGDAHDHGHDEDHDHDGHGESH